MGMYMIACPGCGKPHYWFSGNLDQRCAECKAAPAVPAAPTDNIDSKHE